MLTLSLWLGLSTPPGLAAPEILIGVAQTDITPSYPIRLSGFGGRRQESEGVTQRIWAKALAWADSDAGPAILITVDNLGVPERITREVADRLARHFRFQTERLAITATHTHTAPMLSGVVPTLFGTPIPPDHQATIDRYTREFVDKLEQVALLAVSNQQPSVIEWGLTSVGFAANRRTPGGPVDHDLPLMVIKNAQGKPRAIYFSYACHCVTLSHNHISGDWAGYAMEHIQNDYPGAVALASIGCGADANPDSGVTGDKFSIADEQGEQIASAVRSRLLQPMAPLSESPNVRETRLELALAPPRTQAEWEERARRDDAVGYHARVNLRRLEQGESLPSHIDYPVRTWTFGDQLAMIFLPGEVVVDYSLRLKRELNGRKVWINAYANDSPCYIPSERILQEGGYEGGDAMIYYDQPQVFAPGLEQRIVDVVLRQIPASFHSPSQPGTEGTQPKPVEEARREFSTRPGLMIETVVTEPLIRSPVAIDWDAEGNLWVCEMFDYPTGVREQWEPGGRIVRLRDSDGDGLPDQSDVFLDDLPFPTGLMIWGRGVLVCAAPNILYAEDRDLDGQADHVETLFTGFASENYQARVNSLSLGLDNWIYGANGLLGGVISGRTEDRDIRGHDFRFRLANRRTMDAVPGGTVGKAETDDSSSLEDTAFASWTNIPFETVSGLTQQGRVRDDWDRWFGCDNGSALHFYPHELRYFLRNPHMIAPSANQDPIGDFDMGRVYPVSQALERFNDPQALNRVTSACGLGLYRDTWMGEKYYLNTFTCEPVHNLVHRLKLSMASDFTWRRSRVPGEEEAEFLASRDPWFRPVQIRTGPDGALYVVDMYRFLIEHPRWIQADRLANIDVRAGSERGRIYRVRLENRPLRPVRDLVAMDDVALAHALDSVNGTERDRVHVEILARRHGASQSVLKGLAIGAPWAPTRLQALSVLEGLGALDTETLQRALQDNHESVRAGAVRLCEPGLRQNQSAEAIARGVLELTSDAAFTVAKQLAFTLGEWNDRRAGLALVRLATRWHQHRPMRDALLSSARYHASALLEFALDHESEILEPEHWFPPLIDLAVSSGDRSTLGQTWHRLWPRDETDLTARRLQTLAGLLHTFATLNVRIDTLPPPPKTSSRGGMDWNDLHLRAFQIASQTTHSPQRIAAAIQFLAQPNVREEALDLFCRLAIEAPWPEVRAASRHALQQYDDETIATRLLQRWTLATPLVRQDILPLLLSRASWSKQLLKAVAAHDVSSQEFALTDRQRLRQSTDTELKRRAMELWPDQVQTSREAVILDYAPSLELEGNSDHGELVFAQHCASCHRWSGNGHEVGPDLTGLREKDGAYWIKNILDPNAVVEPRFVAYEITTKDDRSLSGIIRSETASRIELVAGQGLEASVNKNAILSIRASRLSLMPEGFEQLLTPQDMADLLTYLRPQPRVTR